jgi:cell division protein FtsI/penicillin-binding protein 2
MRIFPLLALPLLLAGCACPWAQSHTKAYPHNQAIQRIVDDQAKSAKDTLHPKGLFVVVAEPKTGKILAMQGWKKNIPEQYQSDNGWPVRVLFEPGSTFKPVVVVAALEKGAITEKSKIFCEKGRFDYGGKTIKDHFALGDLTYDQILIKSSNIGASKLSLLLKDKDYYDYMKKFGFGEKTGIAVPMEIAGVVNPPAKWDSLTKVRNAFGQSVAITPIQLTMAYCALANGGLLMKPVLGNGKPSVVRRVCSSQTANLVKNALQKTVSADGTAPLARVEGVTVGGKTGTAQAICPKGGGYFADQYWTMFAGFFPVDHPKYVITVVVDEAAVQPNCNYGGLIASPIFANIANKISKLPRQ